MSCGLLCVKTGVEHLIGYLNLAQHTLAGARIGHAYRNSQGRATGLRQSTEDMG